MAFIGSARARTAVVASAAVLALVTATSMAGAHEGDDDPDSIHACVATTGALRVLSTSGQSCRPNETPLHWTPDGGGSGEELADFKKQLLATDNAGDLVDWSNLQGVPQWILDGLPVWLQDGTVDFGDIEGLPAWLQDGTVGYTDLAGSLPTDSVTGSTVDDGTLTAADLAGDDVNGPVPGAVTSEKILDGAVQGRDLATGAVTPDKQRAVTSSAADPAVRAIGGEGDFPSLPAMVAAAAGGAVLVTGQVQLQLVCLDCSSLVEFELVRTTGGSSVVVSPTYRIDLSPGHRLDVASVTSLDQVPTAGTHAYQIRLRSSGDETVLTAGGAEVNVQVLGAQ